MRSALALNASNGEKKKWVTARTGAVKERNGNKMLRSRAGALGLVSPAPSRLLGNICGYFCRSLAYPRLPGPRRSAHRGEVRRRLRAPRARPHRWQRLPVAEGGLGRRGRPRSAPRALTTIGCAAADVTAHRPGSERDPGRAHLFLIAWEVSLSPSLFPFPSDFILFSPRKLPRGYLPSVPVPIPSPFRGGCSSRTPHPIPRSPPPLRHCSPLVANFGHRRSPALPVLRYAKVTYSFPEVGLRSFHLSSARHELTPSPHAPRAAQGHVLGKPTA